MNVSYDITVYSAPEGVITAIGLERNYDDEVEDFVFTRNGMTFDELISATERLAKEHAYWTTQVWIEPENPYYIIDMTNASNEVQAKVAAFMEALITQTGMINAGDSSVWQQPTDKQEGIVLRWEEGEKE